MNSGIGVGALHQRRSARWRDRGLLRVSGKPSQGPGGKETRARASMDGCRRPSHLADGARARRPQRAGRAARREAVHRDGSVEIPARRPNARLALAKAIRFHGNRLDLGRGPWKPGRRKSLFAQLLCIGGSSEKTGDRTDPPGCMPQPLHSCLDQALTRSINFSPGYFEAGRSEGVAAESEIQVAAFFTILRILVNAAYVSQDHLALHLSA